MASTCATFLAGSKPPCRPLQLS
uniref:Uncharacterized protein n=1 Tax=Rhizophora mucronata TaxID=61149 RepID=A0A2P2IUM8_RHIMU